MTKYVAGIDAGSNTVKVVILANKEISSYSILKTGSNSIQTARKALTNTLNDVDIPFEKLDYLVSTGYGRNYITFVQESITEISCHAKGVHYLFPKARTIIDIGGQDSKAIYLDSGGNVEDFVMNDKCAAGTGRFLEVIAGALNVDLDKMGDESLRASGEVQISSTCTVFAESEVVSHVARGESRSAIIAGIHRSIVSRILAMVRRKQVLPQVVMTGGVAKNKAIAKMIMDDLGQELLIPPEPQITGALGAALFAMEKTTSN